MSGASTQRGAPLIRDGGPLRVHELRGAELDDWDARTVDLPGGDLYQSRVFAEYRSRHGWRPRYLGFDDGVRVLALQRPWAWIGGAGAYIPRGPLVSGRDPAATAARLVAVSRRLAADGVDVVSSDAEIPASVGYAERLAADGFHSIEEIQPSRHRMVLTFGAGATEDGLLMATDMTTRQRIRGAIRKGLRVVRHEGVAPSVQGEGFTAPVAGDTPAAAMGRLYELLVGTAERRAFRLGPRDGFVDWGTSGMAQGRIVLLETLAPDGETLGAAMFYRHGGRMTYSHSADRADRRRAWPGVAHLQLWRAIQLAHREGLGSVDLGGVDVPGARRRPAEGEPMYGLYAFKRSFGAEWQEQVGALEWVARPWRYELGRVTGRLSTMAGRRP